MWRPKERESKMPPVLRLSAKNRRRSAKRKESKKSESVRFFFSFSEVEEIRRRVQSLESRCWDDDDDDDEDKQ